MYSKSHDENIWKLLKKKLLFIKIKMKALKCHDDNNQNHQNAIVSLRSGRWKCSIATRDAIEITKCCRRPHKASRDRSNATANPLSNINNVALSHRSGHAEHQRSRTSHPMSTALCLCLFHDTVISFHKSHRFLVRPAHCGCFLDAAWFLPRRQRASATRLKRDHQQAVPLVGCDLWMTAVIAMRPHSFSISLPAL